MSKKDSKKKGKESKPKKDSTPKNTEFETTKYSGSIALTKLQHVMMNKKNKKGKKIQCLVIPIEANYLTIGKDKDSGKPNGAIYMNVSVITKTPQDDFGQNGFIGQNADSETYKAAKDKEKEKMKKLPILGNIKNWDDSKDPSAGHNSGSAGSDIDEDDDLPF